MLAHSEHDEAMPYGVRVCANEVQSSSDRRWQETFGRMGGVEDEADDVREQRREDGSY